MSKKILAALLAVMMVLSLVPMTALAAEQPTDLATYKIARMGIAADKAAVPIDKTNTGSWANNNDEGKYLYVELNKPAPAGYTIVVNVYPENKAEGVILSTYNAAAGSKALAISFKRMAQWYYGEGSENNFNDKDSLYAQVSVVPITEGSVPEYEATGEGENIKYVFTPLNSVTKDCGVEETQLVELSTTPYVAPSAPAKFSAIATTGTVLEKNMTDVQTDITAADADTNNVIVVTGTSKFAIWEGFSSVPAQQYGNYVALDLTIPEGKSAFITSITEGNLVKVADNGDTLVTNLGNYASQGYKCTVTVGTTKDEGGKQVLDVKDADYTLDFSKVVRSPMAITSAAIDGGEVTASYANGKIILAGPVTFAEEEQETEVTIKVTVTGTVVSVPATITKGAGDELSVAAVKVCGSDVPVDVSGLFVDKDSEAKPAVAAPAVPEVPANMDEGAHKEAMEALANNAADTSKLNFEAEVLANAAAQAANNVAKSLNETLSTVNVPTEAINNGSNTELKKITTAIETVESNADATISDVYLAVQVYMDVAVKSVTENKGTATAITFSITPMQQTILTTKNPDTEANDIQVFDGDTTSGNLDSANAVAVGTADPITIAVPTEVKLPLPAGFIVNGPCTVKHVHKGTTYYYEGTVASDVLTFTSLNGFSDFTILAENPCEAKIGDTLYETLTQAIAAVKEGETITLLKNITADVSVSGDSRNFIIDDGGKTFNPANIKGATTENVNSPYTFTYTKSTDSPGGSTGGSSGGSTGTSGNITVTKPANGSMTSNVSSAKEGDKVTVTVKPDAPYYIVTGVTAKGENGNVAVTKNADGTYSFTMPKGSVSVSATISHIYNLFKDVPTDIAEYGTAIKWAVEKGITLGTDTVAYSTFSPYNPCTRAQMVVFLYRAAGSPAVTGTNAFTDVPSDAEIQKAVQWAVSKGITKGTSDTTFDPYAPCTRGQMVTFLHRNHSEPAATGSNNFADVPADAFYKDAVQWAVNEGITKGTGDNTFAPNDACTRVQMVTFLYRDMGK